MQALSFRDLSKKDGDRMKGICLQRNTDNAKMKSLTFKLCTYHLKMYLFKYILFYISECLLRTCVSSFPLFWSLEQHLMYNLNKFRAIYGLFFSDCIQTDFRTEQLS